jgi:aspartate/methionine/tyrosine aminotransferase
MKTSTRAQVDPFIVMDVMEAARQAEAGGRHIIHMEVGQSSTGAPEQARAAVAAAQDQALGYTVALGLPALREGIARLYRDWYDVDLDPSRVVVTTGSSGAFLLAFTALFDSGAKVGVTEPGYPSYRQILRALGMVPVGLPLDPNAGYRLQPEQIGAGLDGVLLASPNNPTGTMMDRAQMADVMAEAQAQGAAFISDEIYHGLHFGAPAVSALNISNDAYVINSFSKYFSMTGWRVGWMVVPDDHVRTVERLAQNMFICPPHVSQLAALAALDCIPELEENRATYAANRDALVAGLRAMGLTNFAPPDGAFYIYADVSDWTQDSRALARDILDRAGVAVTPGLDFDPVRGHQTLRFSYARSTEDIREGVFRLMRYFENAKKVLDKVE